MCPVADVLALQVKWRAVSFNFPPGYMNVRVFGIEM
jgi:hypothetical protein